MDSDEPNPQPPAPKGARSIVGAYANAAKWRLLLTVGLCVVPTDALARLGALLFFEPRHGVPVLGGWATVGLLFNQSPALVALPEQNGGVLLIQGVAMVALSVVAAKRWTAGSSPFVKGFVAVAVLCGAWLAAVSVGAQVVGTQPRAGVEALMAGGLVFDVLVLRLVRSKLLFTAAALHFCAGLVTFANVILDERGVIDFLEVRPIRAALHLGPFNFADVALAVSAGVAASYVVLSLVSWLVPRRFGFRLPAFRNGGAVDETYAPSDSRQTGSS